MSIAPLFTDAELDAQISAFKAALIALASAAEYTLELPGGSRRLVRRADLPEIRKTLEWLQGQRVGNGVSKKSWHLGSDLSN